MNTTIIIKDDGRSITASYNDGLNSYQCVARSSAHTIEGIFKRLMEKSKIKCHKPRYIKPPRDLEESYYSD